MFFTLLNDLAFWKLLLKEVMMLDIRNLVLMILVERNGKITL